MEDDPEESHSTDSVSFCENVIKAEPEQTDGLTTLSVKIEKSSSSSRDDENSSEPSRKRCFTPTGRADCAPTKDGDLQRHESPYSVAGSEEIFLEGSRRKHFMDSAGGKELIWAVEPEAVECTPDSERPYLPGRPYACDKCDYRARQRTLLRKHMKSHSDDKPFACDQCLFRSKDAGGLRRHARTHSGEKPFKCDQCDYRGVDAGNLQKHRKTHSGERPFACEQCSYRAAVSCKLRLHMRTHTGEKPYACDKCNYKAAQLGDLKRHRRNHEVR